jgi:uncharacterized protein YndB with AHSA1/START domain
MSESGKFSKVPSVRFERLVPGPIERVWEFLTRTELLPSWFGEGRIEPRQGGAVELMGGHVRGTVTRWEPPRRLTYSWNVLQPGEAASAYPESYLALELEPRGDQVLLTLLHLPVLERFEKQNAMGWHAFLDLVEAALRGETPERSAFMRRNAGRYGVDLDNLVR